MSNGKEPVEMPHGFILLMEYKPTFGQDLLYPKNKAAKMICEVMNRSTLNLAQAKQLRDDMGYTIEMYTPSFDDLLKANRS